MSSDLGVLTGLQERTNCLNRESHLVQSSNAIRKHRKALLADLNAFVKITKGIESVVNNANESEKVEVDLDVMVMQAFRTVTRAVRYLDTWEDFKRNIDTSLYPMQVPPTPPADQVDFGLFETSDLASNATRHPAGTRIEDAREHRARKSSRPQYRGSSLTLVRPGSSNSCRQSYRPPSVQGQRNSVAHRISCSVHPGSENLASEKLNALHSSFLTFLGYFIGLHLHSRSSSELLLTTKQSVVSCQDMLELVEEILRRDRERSRPLRKANDNMYDQIAHLLNAAGDVLQPLRTLDEDDTVQLSDGRPLMETATACVRAAGDCVAEARFVIERIGDFEVEPPNIEASNRGSAKLPTAATDTLSVFNVEQHVVPGGNHATPSEPSRSLPPTPLEFPEPHPFVPSTLGPEPTPGNGIAGNTADEPAAPHLASAELSLPPESPFVAPLASLDDFSSSPQTSFSSSGESQDIVHRRLRTDSLDVSSTGDSTTWISSMRDSEISLISQSSTRATSPDANCTDSFVNLSFDSNLAEHSKVSEEGNDEAEASILETTFAHELVYNKEGQISGGTLPALIERLTIPDSTPDATFVSTFYLTFRLFASPTAFAQALIDRFQYVSDSPRISGPVRLRVYNVLKGWLESHWRNDCDKPALELIIPFATRQLQIVLPTAGKRLAILTEKVVKATGPLVPRLISSIGKTNLSIATYVAPDTPLPPSVISKGQLNALKNWKHGGANVSILDFDPLELARQFTLKESQIFCSILPEELLASEWTKKASSMAVNVRALSRISTDLANLVADCILQADEPKKRAATIKQWVKIANKFLDLANYHSLMAIVCSLNQSTILRLKRTWELVSSKTKVILENLKSVVDHDRNYAVLRQRLQSQVPPCVPFVGLYLTDLTFVDAGNQTTRQLPGVGLEESRSVINFDKHMKTAKIISELQRFQIPHRFNEIPELQTWMQDQLVRVRTADQSDVVKDYYRRSLLLEPREQMQLKPSSVDAQASTSSGKERFELFSLRMVSSFTG